MYQIYQVMPGETIDTIATKLGISSEKLREINGLSSNLIVRTGSNIIVPVTNQGGYQTYIVKKGDSVYSIANLYGVDYKTLYSINGLNEGEYIYPNQELIIPTGNNKVYVVQENESLEDVIKKTKTNINDLMNKNSKLLLKEDQLINY